jgi:hypothetical protein
VWENSNDGEKIAVVDQSAWQREALHGDEIQSFN